VLGTGLASVPAATAETPICQQQLPAATDGRLTLDGSPVRPGGSTLAVLSDFRQWPARLIGGGSGETFVSCAPWLPLGRAQVMAHDAAALFDITVPVGTKPGVYVVGVVFYQGSTQPMDGGLKVRLNAVLTVSVEVQTPPGPSPVCQLSHAAAPFGSLLVEGPTTVGAPLSVSLTGVVASRVGKLNEYDRLTYVACLGGRATAVTDLPVATSSFVVPVPLGLRPGGYDLTVTGTFDATVVSWSRSIQVVGSPLPSPVSTSSATSPVPSSTRTVPSSPSLPSPTPSPSSSATSTWWIAGLAAAVLAAGAVVIGIRRRRRQH
jgi:hypothetical protein